MMSVQPSSPRRQGGFTLIELMTSMLIGVILVAGAITIFDAFGRAVRVQNAIANQADSGRYALERLASEIRMAGYREEAWLRPPLDDAIVVSDGGSAPDTVTVRYEATTDCVGVATVGPDFLATNRFDVVNGNLRCNGEVLANGVENLQVLLGEDLDDDGSTNRFLPPAARICTGHGARGGVAGDRGGFPGQLRDLFRGLLAPCHQPDAGDPGTARAAHRADLFVLRQRERREHRFRRWPPQAGNGGRPRAQKPARPVR